MRKLASILAVLVAALGLTLPAAASAGAAVGVSTNIISSLKLPDYTPSTVCESELGRLAADALRVQGGGDAAVFPGGSLRGGLGKGEVTEEDILAVIPGNDRAVRLTLTPGELWELLEYGVSFSSLGEDENISPETSAFEGFPQLSGLWMEYDASQEPGGRIRELRLSDGTQLSREDKSTRLTVILAEGMVNGALGYPVPEDRSSEPLEQGAAELLAAYIAAQGEVEPELVSRIKVVGVASNTIISELRILPFLPLLLIIILLVALPRNKGKLRNLDGSHSNRYKEGGGEQFPG